MSTLKEEALQLHEVHQGKLAVSLKVDIETKHDLSLAYTPGVAEPCLEIAQDREQVYRYTGKGNAVAIVTDGTAVLGLGDIGPEAALPVMEGKACLFKRFGGVDAYPICLNTKDPEEIVRAVQLIAPGFGGINLEDISAPRCFEIEERLIETLDIPVFHDDQHGTAVVVLAALINGAKCLGLELPQVQTVISGAGAAGISICKLLMKAGVRDITLCDRQGAIWEGREGLNGAKTAMAKVTNRAMRKGSLAEVMEGAPICSSVSPVPASSRRRWCAPCHRRRWCSPCQTRFRRSCRSWRWRRGPRWWPPVGRISPIRSTTCWYSPESSRERWQPVPHGSRRK